MANVIIYAGFSIGVAVVIWALIRIVLDMSSTAVKPEEGIHAFVRSFDGNQFQQREERGGKR